MRSHSSCRAQSVIEYLLVVTAVVVVLITAILLKGGLFVKGVDRVLGTPITLLNAHNSHVYPLSVSMAVALCLIIVVIPAV
jgi:hypothetical protein